MQVEVFVLGDVGGEGRVGGDHEEGEGLGAGGGEACFRAVLDVGGADIGDGVEEFGVVVGGHFCGLGWGGGWFGDGEVVGVEVVRGGGCLRTRICQTLG